MSRQHHVTIASTGMFLPGPPIDNETLARMCGPLPADILAGLQTTRRHWLADPTTGEHTTSNSRMAAAAAGDALSRAGMAPDDIDLIVVSTASPEYQLPTVASYVQEHLGLARCAVIELRGGCAGAVQGLDVARRLVEAGAHRNAVVIGSEVISPLLVPMYLGSDPDAIRMRDRLSLYTFGDGAAAVVLTADTSSNADPAVPWTFATACLGGDRKPGMQIVGGGTDIPYAQQIRRKRLVDLRVDATGVTVGGPRVFVTALHDLVRVSGMKSDAVDAFVLPEGNAEYFSDELEAAGLAMDEYDTIQNRIVENLADVGATGSPAVLMALHAGVEAGRIRRGDNLFLLGIEASRYVYAGLSLRW